jgi:methyltransferase family protein
VVLRRVVKFSVAASLTLGALLIASGSTPGLARGFAAVRARNRPDSTAELLEQCEDVPGFLDATDAALFVRLAEIQASGDIRGHLLEIGAWYGRSAIVLGFLKRQNEDLHVCDLFETPPPTAEGRRELAGKGVPLEAPSRAQFEAAYERVHGELPLVHQRASSMLSARELGSNQFRFIHIDGSHVYDAVLADIALARELAADGCIIVFDDFTNLGHLGVAAAVWPAVVRREVEPFACTHAKLYATVGKHHAVAYRDAVETFARERGDEVRRTDFPGATRIIATWPPPRPLRARVLNRARRTLRSSVSWIGSSLGIHRSSRDWTGTRS